MLESVWRCVYVSVKVCAVNSGKFKCFDDEKTASNHTRVRTRNKNRLQRQLKEDEEPEFELDNMGKIYFFLFKLCLQTFVSVCVYVLLCALCPSPLHAPVRHNGPEIWEQAQAERSGNGVGQMGGTLSFLPSLSPFAFDVLWLICLLLTLPSSTHQAWSTLPLFSPPPACFYLYKR